MSVNGHLPRRLLRGCSSILSHVAAKLPRLVLLLLCYDGEGGMVNIPFVLNS